ncbi:MAG: phenylalanine--tRNA ligase subunit beta [Candidatus Eiseniibacteriota bacterium]|nr:MAG: phenylalanine--tRNA ligase subunit beta [Candidatus Eisenbacteria bacterium]
MRIGYNWLREFVEFDMTPEELAESFTMLGFPASCVGPVEPEYPGVLTGVVEKVVKHPKADKLVLCDVSSAERRFKIVCGAPNVRDGMKVAVATVGAVLPGGLKIKKTSIRGEPSEGMLCSGAELGLSDDAAGILELPERTVSGVTLDEHMGAAETVLELEVSHNRSDCLSVYGLAREVAALAGGTVKFPDVPTAGANGTAQRGQDFEVDIEEASDCPRYCGQLLRGVKVGVSPHWLRRRVEIFGFRALNNVVDSTNYCLACFGQPIHAFDYDRMRQKSVLVRRARQGESLVTLDGTERRLNPEVLLITDGELPIALAGIMGGEETEVVESSQNLLLESAHFSPPVVKRGSKVLGLESEASLRFSRGTDPEMAGRCLEYVAGLITSVAGGNRSGKLIDRYPERATARKLVVNPRRISVVLGGAVTDSFMQQSLARLGFGWKTGKKGVEISVPSFRYDMSEEVDVVEEVARSYGYDRFEERAANLSWVVGADEEQELFLEECRSWLVSLGLNEAVTKVLVDPGKAEQFLEPVSGEEPVRLANPASLAEAVLRPSALCSLLEAVSVNLRRGAEDVRLFEVGKVFRRDSGAAAREHYVVAGVLCGRKGPPSWRGRELPECDVFDTKGIVEGLLRKLKVDSHEVLCYDGRVLERELAGYICYDDKRLGVFGAVSRRLLRTFEVERDVFAFELNADELRKASCERVRFAEPSRFPAAKRDIAVVSDAALPQSEVAELIRGLAGEHLQRLELFDVYTGEAIAEGKKSLAYSLSFQSTRRTLSDTDVERIMQRIVQGLEARGIGVRGSSASAN